jgi:anti-sigma factor ChrR (cupin superfamily)
VTYRGTAKRPWSDERKAARCATLKALNDAAHAGEPIFKIGTRVRVNDSFQYAPSRGLLGTVIGLPYWIGKGANDQWIEVDFDDKTEIKIAVKWSRNYFDPFR